MIGEDFRVKIGGGVESLNNACKGWRENMTDGFMGREFVDINKFNHLSQPEE